MCVHVSVLCARMCSCEPHGGQEMTTAVWTCVEDASPSCRPSGRKRPPGGASMCWCDLVNDDLWGMTEWTEAIQDRVEL